MDIATRYEIYKRLFEFASMFSVENHRREQSVEQATAELGDEHAAHRAMYYSTEAESQYTAYSRFQVYMVGKALQEAIGMLPFAETIEEFEEAGLDRIVDEEFLGDILGRLSVVREKDDEYEAMMTKIRKDVAEMDSS